MDDDDMRRGRPTVHKVYGSRTAIIAGVAMIPVARAAVVRGRVHGDAKLHAPTLAKILRRLIRAAGAAGMIGGQALDLEGEGAALPLLERLERIHAPKTGALITESVRLGGSAARAPVRRWLMPSTDTAAPSDSRFRSWTTCST